MVQKEARTGMSWVELLVAAVVLVPWSLVGLLVLYIWRHK